MVEILNTQTTPTDSNRNQVTSDNVSLRAASERHQNAIKAITNLLAIIDQARSNKNKAYADIELYTVKYKEAQTRQRATQESIIAAQLKIDQINSAITGLIAKIDELKGEIDDHENNRAALIARNNELKVLIDAEKKTQQTITAQLTEI